MVSSPAEAGWAEYCRLYPHRETPWEKLAYWEQGRWQLVTDAILKAAGEVRIVRDADVAVGGDSETRA